MVIGVLGLSRSGLRDWLIQRISAVILGVYALVIIGFLLRHPQLEFTTWQSLFNHIGFRIFSILALLSLLLHAWVGIWIVITDYVKIFSVRLLLQIATILILFVYFIWGVAIVWGVTGV